MSDQILPPLEATTRNIPGLSIGMNIGLTDEAIIKTIRLCEPLGGSRTVSPERMLLALLYRRIKQTDARVNKLVKKVTDQQYEIDALKNKK